MFSQFIGVLSSSFHLFRAVLQVNQPHVEERGYHGSADSLITGCTHSAMAIEDCFHQQCSQIFLGMVTMQYQAKQVNLEFFKPEEHLTQYLPWCRII